MVFDRGNVVMSAFSDFHEEALEEVINILGTAFTYQGTAYRGVINSIELSSDFRDGGLLEMIDTVVIVPKCSFATAPQAGQTLGIDGKTVRIEKVDVDEVSYELRCKAAAAGGG